MEREWTVGELAVQVGVSVRTLHHYDEIGLVTPTRSTVGHRRYTEPDIARLTQVVALRSVGLSLGEIQRCLDGGEPLVVTLGRQLRDLNLHLSQTTELRNRLFTVVAKLERGHDLDSYDLTTLIGDTVVLVEGKTKVIEEAGNGEVLVHSKDDITADDGARHDVLAGKATASTQTTSNIFALLEHHGVRTHFVDRVDDTTFRARSVVMIPLELVARRFATGSYRDRHPELVDGTPLADLIVEFFEKDDANHDPLLDFDFEAGVLRRFLPSTRAAAAIGSHAQAGDLLSEEALVESRYAEVSPGLIGQLRSIAASAFEVIENAWEQQGGVYIDFKIEFGFDRETGELLIADVIDSDSARLRFGGVDMSKQSYRDGTATLPEIKKRFDEVAALTDRFS